MRFLSCLQVNNTNITIKPSGQRYKPFHKIAAFVKETLELFFFTMHNFGAIAPWCQVRQEGKASNSW